MNNLQAAEEKLAALRRRFAVSMTSRLEAIEAAVAEGSADAERLFHSLAGTAGTFGFMAISALAGHGEETCAVGDHAAMRRTIDDLCAAVRSTAECGAALTLVAADDPPAEGEQPSARILCVEDDPDQAAYVATVLHDAGYHAAVAHDAAEFAKIVERFQ